MLGWILKRDDDHRPKTVNCSWFVGVEKRAVLAEVITSFGDPRIMDKRRCLQVMRKLLYLLNQGQTFTMREAATVLFSATKLFRFKDLHLRRLVYLIAEELCPIVEEGDINESALLVLDLMSFNAPSTSLQAYAVRLLCRITNVPSSIKIEEYLKYAILSVDRDVSSAGLVCALHLLKKDPGTVIKVCEQVGTVAAESCGLVKFHALCLLSRMQEIETNLGIRELARPHIDKILSYELRLRAKHKDHPLLTCLVIRLITQPQINRTSRPDDLYSIYIKRRCLAGVCGFGHLLGNEMVAIEGLYSVMKLRIIGANVVEAAIREVHRLIPYHEMLRVRDDLSIFHDEIPAVLNVGRSMLKWSRIKNHLQPDDDAAQLAKSKTQGPAPAIDNIYLRKRMIAVSDPLLC